MTNNTMNETPKLIIGNKNYSSWSLRPWLLLSAHNIPFEEIVVPLYTEYTARELAKYSAAGKVPVLHHADAVIWDSLAICEYISEQFLAGKGWPAAADARAYARSCSAEMHSGFYAIREFLPMNCRASNRHITRTDEIKKDVARLDQMWTELRSKYGAYGPWLFGDFSIADCMFAPVAIRFNTYQVKVSEVAEKYVKQVLAHHKVQQWMSEGAAETEVITGFEVGQ